MKRLGTVLVTVIALLAFAPAAGAASPRENFDTTGFDAFGSVCGQQTCTDTNLFADSQTTASGETFTFSCADQFTYNIRNGRGNGNGGCTESLDFNVADDLSSASLPPTQYEVCGRGHCTTITVSAELQAIGPAASFRARSTERDGTCTFTYSESGHRRPASGTVTFDGATVVVEGSIRSSSVSFTSRCR